MPPADPSLSDDASPAPADRLLPTGTVTFLFTDIEGSTKRSPRPAPEGALMRVPEGRGARRPALQVRALPSAS